MSHLGSRCRAVAGRAARSARSPFHFGHVATMASITTHNTSPSASRLEPPSTTSRTSTSTFTSSSPSSPPLASRPARTDSPIRSAILTAALGHVPVLGFTPEAITRGAHDAGYLGATTSLFSSRVSSPTTDGPTELVLFHLRQSRAELCRRFGPSHNHGNQSSSRPSSPTTLNQLFVARLGLSAPVLHHHASAVGLLSLPHNIPSAATELAALADDLLVLTGDRVLDSRWYTRRAGVAAVYAALEAYMAAAFPASSSSPSPSHPSSPTELTAAQTAAAEAFVADRLAELDQVGTVFSNVGQFVDFGVRSVLNLARSRGVWV